MVDTYKVAFTTKGTPVAFWIIPQHHLSDIFHRPGDGVNFPTGRSGLSISEGLDPKSKRIPDLYCSAVNGFCTALDLARTYDRFIIPFWTVIYSTLGFLGVVAGSRIRISVIFPSSHIYSRIYGRAIQVPGQYSPDFT